MKLGTTLALALLTGTLTLGAAAEHGYALTDGQNQAVAQCTSRETRALNQLSGIEEKILVRFDKIIAAATSKKNRALAQNSAKSAQVSTRAEQCRANAVK